MSPPPQRGILAALALVAQPVVFAVTAIAALVTMPSVAYLYPDPSYPYLLNGLAVTIGPGPGHTDHPGTSLQWFVGIIELLTHWLTGAGVVLADDVAARPEHYLTIVAVVIVLGQALALWYLGRRLRTSMTIGAALLGQAAVLGTAALMPYRLYVIPEAFLLIWAMVLVALLAPRLADPARFAPWQHTVVVGVVIAIGVTGKIIFAPLALMPLALYRWRSLVQVYGSALIASLLILWVARDRFDDMVRWFGAVSLTSARYPGEEITHTVAEGIATVPANLVVHYPSLVIGLGLAIAGIVIARRRRPAMRGTLLVRPAAALALATLGTLAMTYKAYRINDLVLLAVIGGAMAAFGWFLIAPPRAGVRATWRMAVPALAAALAIVVGIVGTARWITSVRSETDYTRMMTFLDEQVTSGASAALGYGVFNEATSLFFGNAYANNIVQAQTIAAHPRWYDYSIWNGDVYAYTVDGSTLLPCADLAALAASPGGLLIAPGRPMNPVMPGEQYTDMVVSPEATFGAQVVYRVESVTCA